MIDEFIKNDSKNYGLATYKYIIIRVDFTLGKKNVIFYVSYFRAKNSNPSKQELSVRKFKKLKNYIFSILPKARSTLVIN